MRLDNKSPMIGKHYRFVLHGANGLGGGATFQGKVLSIENGFIEVENTQKKKSEFRGNYFVNTRLILYFHPLLENEVKW